MILHLNFWLDYGDGNFEEATFGCMLTMPFFPVFEIIQLFRELLKKE